MRWDVCKGEMRVKSPLLELKSVLQSFATEEANEGELVALTGAGGQAQDIWREHSRSGTLVTHCVCDENTSKKKKCRARLELSCGNGMRDGMFKMAGEGQDIYIRAKVSHAGELRRSRRPTSFWLCSLRRSRGTHP